MIGAAKLQIIYDMKLFEALNFYREPIKRLVMAGFKPEDCEFLGLYEDYLSMQNEGGKKEWMVAVLSEKYGISKRQVYYKIKHFETDCTKCAV